MMFWLLALITGAVGAAPLLLSGRIGLTIGWGAIGTLIAAGLYYLITPSLVWPLWGLVGFLTLLYWAVSAVIHCVAEDRSTATLTVPAIGVAVFLMMLVGGCETWRAQDYANLIGQVEERVWTQDVQPKDPRHVRLVPLELANWLADKQLGDAPGAIGSQFQISRDHMTLQMIKGELWYVAPLDFRGFAVWQSSQGAPGYVMVHGEDPTRPAIVKLGEKFAYMPGSYFGSNLERHLWASGYYAKGLTEYSFEIDEEGHPWWVVTAYKPTITWFGWKTEGVVVVNPTTGQHAFYEMGKVPQWVDRAVPASFVNSYIKNWGSYRAGWWNSFWNQKDLVEPETSNIAYGSDGEPYWVTGVTSNNSKDEALIGLMYVDSRTGRTIFYKAVGGTDTAILTAVDNKVAYKKWHGRDPVFYNIYGTMAAIVPLLGENHTFQGVAIVNVETQQVAEGANQYVALREYQKLLTGTGMRIAPEMAKDRKTLKGVVARFASEIKKDTGTLYYLQLAGVPHLFTGSSELSTKLPLTKAGDDVQLVFIDSGEDVMPLVGFDNLSIGLKATKLQRDLRGAETAGQTAVDARREDRTVEGEFKNMSPEEKKKLLELKKKLGK